MKKTILIFGSICTAILLLLQLERWSLFAIGGRNELFLIIFGVLFLILGVLISRYLSVKTAIRKKTKRQTILSEQELRVLRLVADGHTNKSIAENLFIAESTVKSHVSNILVKLDAKRRTEAVKIGQDLEII